MTISITSLGANSKNNGFGADNTWTITGAPLGTGDIVVFVATDVGGGFISDLPSSVTVAGQTAVPIGTSVITGNSTNSGVNFNAWLANSVSGTTGSIAITFGGALGSYNLAQATWFLINGEDASTPVLTHTDATSFTWGNTSATVTGTIPVGGAAIAAIFEQTTDANTLSYVWTNCDSSTDTVTELVTNVGNGLTSGGNHNQTSSGSTTITVTTNPLIINRLANFNFELAMVTFGALTTGPVLMPQICL